MRHTLIITGGGTGGHVYPALSIIEQLTNRDASAARPHGPPGGAGSGPEPGAGQPSGAHLGHEPLIPVYIGSATGLERSIIPRMGIASHLFPMAAPRSPRGVALTALALVRSMAVMRRTRPRATIATGGYVSSPVMIASWLLRVPVVLFLPDVVPGKAGRLLAPLASRIAVATDQAQAYLPAGKTVVTGYPVRREVETASRSEGRQRFDLPAEARVICVFGGSQGSRSLNQALAGRLAELLARYHILHVCGEKRFAEAVAAARGLTTEERERYHLFPYLHDRDMAAALAAADLAICRSGASVLGELPALGLPSILVPLPAQGVHQRENAEYLVCAGAAVLVPDSEVAMRLTAEVERIFEEPGTLERMQAAARARARPDAAAHIAGLVAELVA